MRIPRDPFNRKVQDDAMFEALRNTANTAIYLDTSSLVWMYRLALGARTEFIEWATTGLLSGKLHVPVWALHELHKHRRSIDTLFPARPKVKAVEAELRFLTEAASLFVDDTLAISKAFVDRKQYLEFLEKAKNDLSRALGLLKDVKVSKVENQLLPFFESSSLTSSLPDFTELQKEFSARSEGRVPPGYQDSSKKGDLGHVGGDGANRYGDFVFWKEILAHAKSDEAIRKIIIVTHDRKPDWVFGPDQFIDYDGKLCANNGSPKVVTCPHPTLAHEAASVANIDELYIVTIPQLIQLISTHGDAKEVQQLARAVQIEQQAEDERAAGAETPQAVESDTAPSPESAVKDDVEAADEAVAEVEVEPVPPAIDANVQVPAPQSEIAECLNALSHEALADAEYQAIGGDGTPDSIIRALKTYNWYRQNPAISGVSSAVADEKSTHEQIFILGRNVYQAACGNSNSAMQLMEGLDDFLRRKPFPRGEIFFAGLLFEAYFNSHGLVRASPKSDYLVPLFISAMTPRFADVTSWFRGKISAYAGNFVRLPGDGPPTDIFEITEVDGHVSDIRLRGMSVVRAADPVFDSSSLPSNCTDLKLKQEIASHFATVEAYVTLAPPLNEKRDLSHLAFITWAPDTDVVFPPRP